MNRWKLFFGIMIILVLSGGFFVYRNQVPHSEFRDSISLGYNQQASVMRAETIKDVLPLEINKTSLWSRIKQPFENNKRRIQGLYVNDFDTVIGNQAKQNELIQFTQQRGFNTLYLYDLTNIISNPVTKTQLQSFITLAHQSGLKVGGVGGSEHRLIGGAGTYSRLDYNNTTTLPIQKFDLLNLENEFWIYHNPPTESGQPETFAIYTQWLTNITNMLTGTTPEFDVYVGNIKDDGSGFTPEQVAWDLVAKNKRIMYAMYIPSVDFHAPAWGLNYIDEKLKLLADVAALQNKNIDIVIIFSGRDIHMKDWFIENSFVSTYHKVLTAYNNWGTTWGEETAQNKNRLKFKGYFVYTYQDSDSSSVTGVKDLPFAW